MSIEHKGTGNINKSRWVATAAAVLALGANCAPQSGEPPVVEKSSIQDKSLQHNALPSVEALARQSLVLANELGALPGSRIIEVPSNPAKWQTSLIESHRIFYRPTPHQEIALSYSTELTDTDKRMLVTCDVWQNQGDHTDLSYLSATLRGTTTDELRHVQFSCDEFGQTEVSASIGEDRQIIVGGIADQPQPRAITHTVATLYDIANSFPTTTR